MSPSLIIVSALLLIALLLIIRFSIKKNVHPISTNSEAIPSTIVLISPLIIWLVLVKYLKIDHSLFLKDSIIIKSILIGIIPIYLLGKK